MKNEKHQQAKNLFFQTNLSKTEIANRLGVNRRTIMLWCQMGNWERLKQSAEHMPSMVAEKCYFLLDHYTSHLLSSNGVISTFGPKEANAINQMATSIKKLKNRSAINEAMEMFNFFLEFVKKQNPELLHTVTPLVEGYIATRRDTSVDSFVPHNFTADAKMDESIREQEIIEKWKDEDDQQIMEEEYFAFLKHLEEKKKTTSCHPEPVEGHPEPAEGHPEPAEGLTEPAEGRRVEAKTLTSTPSKNLEFIHAIPGGFALPPFTLGEYKQTATAEATTIVEDTYCHPEPVEDLPEPVDRGNLPEPVEGRHAGSTPTLALACYNPGDAEVLTLTPTLTTTHGEHSRTNAPTPGEAPALNTALAPNKTHGTQMTPLQTFAHCKFLEATAPKREPNCWSRLYKELKAIFPGEITTLEELDELKFPPQRREEVLNILRAGYPIPGFEQLQLKLILEDKNKNNNQNLAA